MKGERHTIERGVTVAVTALVVTSMLIGTVAGIPLPAGDTDSIVGDSPVQGSATGEARTERQNVTISPQPDKTVVTSGRNYTFDVTTGVAEAISNPTLDIVVSSSGETTPVITGVTSRDGDYGVATIGLATQSQSLTGGEFAADTVHRALVQVYVPEGTESFQLEARVGDSSQTDDTITHEYETTDAAPSWKQLAALAESRQRTAANLNRGYTNTVDSRSVDAITRRGLWRTYVGTTKFTAGLFWGKIPYIGPGLDIALKLDGYREYYQSVRQGESYPDPWLGSTSRAQMQMLENGFTAVELDRVDHEGNTSYVLRRVRDLAAEEATAWRNHNRDRALEKLKRQHEYLTPTDTYPDLYVDLPETVALNLDPTGSVFEPAPGSQFSLYNAAERQRSEAAEGPQTEYASEAAFENAELFFAGVRNYSATQAPTLEATISTVQDPDPSVTLTNKEAVREQLATEGTVNATFKVENSGGATTIQGYLSLSYSNDTLSVRDIKQVDEEPDGEVRRDATYTATDRGAYVNDTLTNTSLPGALVNTQDGDREIMDRAVIDIYERFSAGETNTYTVTFERTGDRSEPANISYRAAFLPLVHEETTQATFVRAPDDTGETGPQGWTVRTVENASTLQLDIEGSGTKTDPYVIRTASQLQSIQKDLDAHYVLGEDIDASATADWNGGSGFDPIGSETAFTGTLDGAGHTISNLTISRYWTTYVGMFADISAGGVVENLVLRNADIRAESYKATLAGINSGTIRRVAATGSVTGPYGRAGGLVGVNGGNVTESTADVSVSGVDGDLMGGLVGSNYGTITESSGTGSVSGYHYLGGLVGSNSGTIKQSYATAGVSGRYYNGGLVGDSDGIVTDAYWDVNATGESASDGGIKRTTDELTGPHVAGNVSGLDFGETWQSCPNGYPALAWRDINTPPTANGDSYTTTENTTLSVSAPGVLGDDTDSDGDDLVVSVVQRPSNGTVTFDSDGSFEYAPDPSVVGTDTFVYDVQDGNGGTDRATVTVTVKPDRQGLTVDAPVTAKSGAELQFVLSAANAGSIIIGGDTGGWIIEETNPASLTTVPAPSETPYRSESGDTWGHVFSSIDNHTFSVTLDAPNETGTYNFTAKSIANETDVVENFSVTVERAVPEFAIDYAVENTTVAVGDPVPVVATVENTGNASGTAEVRFTVNGTRITTKTATVAPGATARVSTELNFSSTGTQAVAVQGLNETTISVREPAAFHIGYAVGNRTLLVGENVTITATVENVGGIADTTTVGFFVDDEAINFQTVDLAAGNTTTILTTTSFKTVGNHTVSVGGLNTTTVSVEAAGPDISGVSSAVASAAAGEDNTLDRSDVLTVVRAYLGERPIDNQSLNRSEVLAIVQYYIMG